MNEKTFLQNYFQQFCHLVMDDESIFDQLIQIKKALISISNAQKKVIIVGNGASAAIASHVCVDLTKNTRIRAINFNEADLLTCFSNDYGYERWVEKAIEFYGDMGDALIAISSSGQSKNILNGCHTGRSKGFSTIITLSGFRPDNPLRELGDVNLWINSKSYNFVESIHQFWLLSLVDLIIGKSEYPSS